MFKGHFSLLSWKDSNPRKRNQNPMCYHYTTGQFLIATAKVLLFLLPPRKISTFFQKILLYPQKTSHSRMFSPVWTALAGGATSSCQGFSTSRVSTGTVYSSWMRCSSWSVVIFRHSSTGAGISTTARFLSR